MPITRREFLRTGLGGLGLAAHGLPLATLAAGAQSRKKNVLFIAVDDLRPELGCYGHQQIISPHIDALARNGTLFRRAYCQQAVCSPSRTSLMTGLRPDSTRVYDLHTHFRKTIPDAVTLTQQFMAHGYHAEGIGKIYHLGLNDQASWTVPWIGGSGGKRMYALQTNQGLRKRKRAEAETNGLTGKQLRRASLGPPVEAADVRDAAYGDGNRTELALQAMRRLRTAGKPFFLAVGFSKPHLPFNCPKKYWALYDRARIDLAGNPFAPKDAPHLALTRWGELRVYEGIPKEGPVTDEQARELIHGYYACVSFVDAQVGKLLAELDRLGLRENTIVVLWGDHGWQLGEHGFWCKHTNFEVATRSPLIVSAPGMKGGQSSNALTEFVDIYPSLCELAGLPIPDGLEGTSFVPLLTDPARPWKQAAFSQYPRANYMGYTMRTDRYRYTEWRWRRKGKPKETLRELYDHKLDPDENVNIAGRPQNAQLVKTLAAMLAGGWQAARP